MLQLASKAGHPLSALWLNDALTVLTPQLHNLSGSSVLQLLQSLGTMQQLQSSSAGYERMESSKMRAFWVALQQRLVEVVPDLDILGVAAVISGLVQVRQAPSVQLQQVVAKCMQDNELRSGTGLQAAALWMLLEALLDTQAVLFIAPSEQLLDAVLLQLPKHSDDTMLSQSRRHRSYSSGRASRQRLLLQLAAALAAGGSWGSYMPAFELCSLLCWACLQEDHSSLSPGVWLGLVVRFEGLGYTPSGAWLAAARKHLEQHPLLSMQEDG
jgi:hypothetical protein